MRQNLRHLHPAAVGSLQIEGVGVRAGEASRMGQERTYLLVRLFEFFHHHPGIFDQQVHHRLQRALSPLSGNLSDGFAQIGAVLAAKHHDRHIPKRIGLRAERIPFPSFQQVDQLAPEVACAQIPDKSCQRPGLPKPRHQPRHQIGLNGNSAIVARDHIEACIHAARQIAVEDIQRDLGCISVHLRVGRIDVKASGDVGYLRFGACRQSDLQRLCNTCQLVGLFRRSDSNARSLPMGEIHAVVVLLGIVDQFDDFLGRCIGARGIVTSCGNAPRSAAHSLINARLHFLHFSGSRDTLLICAHHIRPDLTVTQQGNHVAAKALFLYLIDVFREGAPVDHDPGLAVESLNHPLNRLNGGLVIDEGVDFVPHIIFPVLAHPVTADRCVGISALAAHEGGDALPHIALAAGIQEQRAVRMGMRVDEAGRHQLAAHVHTVFLLLDASDGRDLISDNSDIRRIGRFSCSVDDLCVFQYQRVHFPAPLPFRRFRPLPSFSSLRR